MSTTPHAIPSKVEAEQGEVIVDGPDGVAYSMTPDAALETSDRLQQASITAKQQGTSPSDAQPEQ